MNLTFASMLMRMNRRGTDVLNIRRISMSMLKVDLVEALRNNGCVVTPVVGVTCAFEYCQLV